MSATLKIRTVRVLGSTLLSGAQVTASGVLLLGVLGLHALDAQEPATGANEPAVQVLDQGADGVCDAEATAAAAARTAVKLAGSDAAPEARAQSLLARMTLQEKLEYIGGQGNRIRAIPRLGIPEIMMSDGRLGLRKGGMKSVAYPAQICTASTWNADLVRRMGTTFGNDFRRRGFHIALAPWVDIIRDPRGGRGFEAYSEDPFLTGTIASAQITGMQAQGVLATLTCLACNNQETSRNFYSAEVDERTLREIYLEAFRIPVMDAKAACIMAAFNKVNGVSCSENTFLLTDVLRTGWGFTGIVMPDWTAARNGVAAANAGLDLEMPTGKAMSVEIMQAAIAAGTVTEATIDEKVRRILRTIILAGFLDQERVDTKPDGDDPASVQAALDVAREGIVLLKNERGTLPLDLQQCRRIAIVGKQARRDFVSGGGSSIMSTNHSTSLYDALQKRVQACDYLDVGVTIDDAMRKSLPFAGPVTMELYTNRHLSGKPAVVREVPSIAADFGENPPAEGFPKEFSVRWKAHITAPTDGLYTFVSQANDGVTVTVGGTPVIADWRLRRRSFLNQGIVRLRAGEVREIIVDYFYGGRGGAGLRLGWLPAESLARAVESARQADAVLICVGTDHTTEGEGSERPFALNTMQQALVEELPKANPRSVVILFGGGGVDFRGWIDRTPAVVQAWYPGQDGGVAIQEIITGVVNPSGKLPVTFPKQIEDHPSFPYFLNPQDMKKARAVYGEGVFVGYRGYDAKDIEPMFPFGYGLSYTTFGYADLAVVRTSDGMCTARFRIRNTGAREGSEAAQLYIAPPSGQVPRPPRELKGYTKVRLKPGEEKTVEIPIAANAFAYWSPAGNKWTVDAGTYRIHIGSNSRDLRLVGEVEMPAR
jgi:beta-glucosidase